MATHILDQYIAKMLRTILVCFCMSVGQTALAQYSLYVGEAKFLSPPNTEGYISSAQWSASNGCIQFNRADEAGAIIEITEYFSGSATISMFYTERYFNNRTGREQARSGSKSYTISCQAVSIILSDGSLEMKPGETKHLSYSWSPSGHSSKARIEWKTSDSSVADVEGGSGYATITAKKAGSTNITAITNLGPSMSCVVTVKAVDPDRVSLPSSERIKVGESVKLTPTLSPSDAQSTFTWSSDNTSVASVNPSGAVGEVKGKKTGTANITVKTENEKTAICQVTVEKGDLTLTCDTESGLIAKGTKVTLTASRSDAEIYYTLDGSSPTSNSTRYNNGITLDKNVTLKAIAMGSEYNPSNILSRQYQVTGLKVTNYYPNVKTQNRDAIPSITFSENIDIKSNNGAQLRLEGIEENVKGEIVAMGKTLYFVPDKLLSVGLYTLTIPSSLVGSSEGDNLYIDFPFEIINRMPADSEKFTALAVGDGHSLALQKNGTLWGWGKNWSKQIDSTYGGSGNKPREIMTDVKDIAAGGSSSYAIKNDNSLWSWGNNSYGELGRDGAGLDAPIKVMDNVRKVRMCNYHTLILKNDGSLWTCGSGYNYALGDGSTEDRKIPKQIMTDVKDIAVGSSEGLAIKNNGTLWAWGQFYGITFDGVYYSKVQYPQKVLPDISKVEVGIGVFVVKDDGTLWRCDELEEVKLINDVKDISACHWSVMAIKNNGALWIADWENPNGNDGKWIVSSEKMRDVAIIACGESHKIVAKTDGTLWAWGDNKYGQLGNEYIESTDTPQCIPSDLFVTITAFDLEQKNVELHSGEKFLIRPVVSPNGAAYNDIIFKSDNTSVASVSQRGIITAKQSGTTTISVRVDDKFIATCIVTVTGDNDVNIINSAHGIVTSSVQKAKAGEEVTLTILPESGYMLENLYVTDADGRSVSCQVDGNTATFIMPSKSVTVNATFVNATWIISTSKAGYATFFDSKWAVSLPSGLSARTVSGVSNGKLIYKGLSGGFVPKATGVLLESVNKREETFTLTRTAGNATYNGTNLLHGNDEAGMTSADGDYYYYKLSYGATGSDLDDVFGWYWGTANGGAFQIEGHRAWLAVPKSTGVKSFVIDGEVTGINEPEAEAAKTIAYDLQGRRIEQPTRRGIYIVSGKKVVIK